MNYEFSHRNYKNFKVFADNRLPHRAYFIPFGDERKLLSCDVLDERKKSDKVTLLNGDWQFKYFSAVSRLGCSLDTDKTDFDTVKVPSVWQWTGYEKPFYVNQKYLFPTKPPVIPKDCAVAVYVKKIDISNPEIRRIITFQGVAAGIELYANGKYVGYGEGAHNPQEFDLTPYLIEGQNELLALVYKFTNGTYLECQDMFRSNGIFRDAYITELGGAYVWDYQAIAKKTEAGYDLAVRAEATGDVSARLYDGDTLLAGGVVKAGADLVLHCVPEEWSAENPRLYTLLLNVGDYFVRQEIGFKEVKIDGRVFKINGAAVKLKGVNHHDSTPDNGYYMSEEQLERDVKIIKEYNCNCVRTSHYPPEPLFIKLADRYGLYIVDEADIETHGTNFPTYRPNRISNNKKWKEHYWDRVFAMYMRDRSDPCVIMWSLGNEAGGWHNQDYCYANLKKLTELPVHYEGAVRTPRIAYDVVSEMYPHVKRFADIKSGKGLKKPYFNKPYFMCEYAHAMGVGPGSLAEYWDEIYTADYFTGGCIWEFCDHAAFHVDGKYAYTYGGDHGEFVHDKNFCVDGLFFPDRTPHTGAKNMREIYAPLRFSKTSEGFELFNTDAFTPSDVYDVSWKLLNDGKTADKGKLALSVAPGQKKTFKLELKPDGDSFIVFETSRDGKYVSRCQFALSESVGSLEIQKGAILTDGKIAFDGGSAEFLPDGLSVEVAGRRYVAGGGFSIYRAPFDNDMYIDKDWKKIGLDKAKFRLVSSVAETKDGVPEIRQSYRAGLVGGNAFVEAVWRVGADGTIGLTAALSFDFKVELPRFGFAFTMPKGFDRARYYGMGDCESYRDITAQCVMGVWELDAGAFEDKYIKPQESGNRTKVRWAEITDGNVGIKILAQGCELEFKTAKNTVDDYANAAHQEDLPERAETIVTIDGYMRGTGSNSCGMPPLEQYKIVMKKGDKLAFGFNLQPITVKKTEKPDVLKKAVKAADDAKAKPAAKSAAKKSPAKPQAAKPAEKISDGEKTVKKPKKPVETARKSAEKPQKKA